MPELVETSQDELVELESLRELKGLRELKRLRDLKTDKYPKFQSYQEMAEWVGQKYPAIPKPNILQFLQNIGTGLIRFPPGMATLLEQVVTKPKEAGMGLAQFMATGALKGIASAREMPSPMKPSFDIAEALAKVIVPPLRKPISAIQESRKQLARETFEQFQEYPLETVMELTAPILITKGAFGITRRLRAMGKPKLATAIESIPKNISQEEWIQRAITITNELSPAEKASLSEGLARQRLELARMKKVEKVIAGERPIEGEGFIMKEPPIGRLRKAPRKLLEAPEELPTEAIPREALPPAKVQVPKFKDTQEALAFGEANLGKKEIITKLDRLAQEVNAEALALRKAKQLDESMLKTQEAGLYTEASERAKGITKPEVKVAPVGEKLYYSSQLNRIFSEAEVTKVKTPLGIQWKIGDKITSRYPISDFTGEKPVGLAQNLYERGQKALAEYQKVGEEVVKGEAPTITEKQLGVLQDKRTELVRKQETWQAQVDKTTKELETTANKYYPAVKKRLGEYEAEANKLQGQIDQIDKYGDKFTDFVDKAEVAAKQRIRKRGVRLKMGIDPSELADYTIIGAAKIARGTVKFAEWSKEMIGEFGEPIRPHLLAIYRQAKSEHIDFMREATEIEVPGGKERGFITSVKEEIPEVAKKVAGQYIPRSTDELAIKARTLIQTEMGVAEHLAKTGTDEKAVATASELIKHYNDLAESATNRVEADMFYDKAAEYANIIAPKLTELGRSVQAASILGRLTPEGMLRFAAKEIQRYNESIAGKRFAKQIPEITGEQSRYILTEMKKIEVMPDGMGKAMAFRKMQNYIADLVPSPLYKKLINVWKAGLLTGIKTSGLNTFSNLFHGISEVVKDIPAVGVDNVASLFTGKRTLAFTFKGTVGGIKEGFGKGWRYLKTGFDERDVAIKLDYRRIGYGTSKFAKGLQAYEQTIFKVMGAEDQPFYYGTKARSLQSQAIVQAKNLKLKGESAKQFIDKLVENPTDEMLRNAVNDAEISVFQNRTFLGQAARQIQKIPGGELVVPFGRTPAAVAMQLVNYSPIGIVKIIVENIGRGRFDQRLFSQGIGRGLTGTAILYIGERLFEKGLITLDYPKGEKERKQWELEGKKANSIQFGGAWRNVNVLGPAGMVLLTGGHFKRGLDETGSVFGGIARATAGGAKSLTEQTFLKGLNSAVDALSDPERFFPGYITGTAGSIVPTIMGDIARATDIGERRIESPFESIKSRIPGLRQTLEPKIDILGRELERGGSFLETMIDPTRPSKIKDSPVINELKRLWSEGYKATPAQLGDKRGYKGLTPQQNTKLWKLSGNIIEKSLNLVIVNNEYKKLTDEEKVKVIDAFVAESKMIARVSMVGEITKGLRDEGLKNKLIELKENGLLTSEVLKRFLTLPVSSLQE